MGRPALAMVVMTVVALAGCSGVAPTPTPIRGTDPPDAPATPSPTTDPVTARIGLDGNTYDLAYDAASDTIWLIVHLEDHRPQLIRFDPATRKQHSWPLPPTDHNGFLGQVKVGDDGVIWISNNYSISRFDPETEELLSVEFPLDLDGVPHEVAMNGGTWPSSIAPFGGDLLVARNNVPFLLRLDDRLRTTGRVALPDGFGGTEALAVDDGSIFATRHMPPADQVAVLRADGRQIATVDAQTWRLEAGMTGVLASGGELVLISPDSEATRLPDVIRPTPSSLAVSDGAGGVVVYDGSTHSVRRSQDGEVTGSFELKGVTVKVFPPLPDSSPIEAMSWPEVTDLAVDARGTIWCLGCGYRELVGLNP